MSSRDHASAKNPLPPFVTIPQDKNDKQRKIKNVATQADYEELEKNYTFVPENNSSRTWQDRMVKNYHRNLYKEYVIADLSKNGQVGLRWRTRREVEIGKGHETCGNKHCPSYHVKTNQRQNLDEYDTSTMPNTQEEEEELLKRVAYGLGLFDYEVNFGYKEAGIAKNELVKLRLCLKCAPLLFYGKGGALGARYARTGLGPKKESAPTESDDSSSQVDKRRRKHKKHKRKRKKRNSDHSIEKADGDNHSRHKKKRKHRRSRRSTS